MTTEKLFNPNDGLTGRDGGPYLDVEEMKAAEVRRAAVEGREPNFDNLQPTAGVPLVSAATLLNNVPVTSNPSQARNLNAAFGGAVEAAAKSKDAVSAKPVSERPQLSTGKTAQERNVERAKKRAERNEEPEEVTEETNEEPVLP